MISEKIDFRKDWFQKRLISEKIDFRKDWFKKRLNYELIKRKFDLMTDWFKESLIDWRIDLMKDWLNKRMIKKEIDWLKKHWMIFLFFKYIYWLLNYQSPTGKTHARTWRSKKNENHVVGWCSDTLAIMGIWILAYPVSHRE